MLDGHSSWTACTVSWEGFSTVLPSLRCMGLAVHWRWLEQLGQAGPSHSLLFCLSVLLPSGPGCVNAWTKLTQQDQPYDTVVLHLRKQHFLLSGLSWKQDMEDHLCTLAKVSASFASTCIWSCWRNRCSIHALIKAGRSSSSFNAWRKCVTRQQWCTV